MKIVAPRVVTHYFANAGNAEEGILRRQAQAFVEGDKSGNLQRLRSLEPKFRKVIETGRANAVATPESESDRVLATLKSIEPGWHRVLEAGGLVLMLPSKAEPEARVNTMAWVSNRSDVTATMRTNSYTSPGSCLLTRSGRVRAHVYGRWRELLFAFENDRNIRDTHRLHVYQRSYVLEYTLGQMTVRLLCPNILSSVL
jgi:hypothetical protein